jgi:hypothetical protein
VTHVVVWLHSRGKFLIQFLIFAVGNVAFFFVYVLIVYFWSSVRERLR